MLGGAVEKMWFRLGQEFAASGHRVTHVSRTFKGLPRDETIGGVLHRRVGGYSTPRSLVLLKALDLLFTLRATAEVPRNSDIVVTNTFWSPVVMPNALKARLYVDVQRVPKGQFRRYNRRSTFRASSRSIQEKLFSELPKDRHHQVTYVPNPLPFSPPPYTDLTRKKPVILYCGRVHPEKGIDLLIRAWNQMDDEGQLVIVGPWDVSQGGGGERFKDGLMRLSTRRNVTFLGPIFDEGALGEQYRDAAIFCYPSVAEMGEAAPLAPREAMAWGCVPVVSGLECFQDFIHHDSNGLVFNHRGQDPVGELTVALKRLFDTETRNKLAHGAQLIRETHSPRAIANLFLEDFSRIIRGRTEASIGAGQDPGEGSMVART